MPQILTPQEIYQRLIDIAKADGIISKDEQALIDSVRSNIDKYYKVLKASYEDEIVTSEEQYSMYESRRQILHEALSVAKEDDQVTQEEFNLLSLIREIIEDMEHNEHY